MTFPKLLIIIATFLFGIIGIAILFKEDNRTLPIEATVLAPLEVELDKEIRMITTSEPLKQASSSVYEEPSTSQSSNNEPPEIDRIVQLFNKKDPRLPIVETI